MKVIKSKKFEGAYILKGDKDLIRDRGRYVDHIFLNDFKFIDNKVEVQYVSYSAHYKKWYQDTMCMSKENFQEIRKCANL